jgi:ribosomal protein S18 acetylase RimI-like enzyme
MNSDLASLRRLEPSESWLAGFVEMGCEVVPVGPFRIIFGGVHSAWLNQAMPYEPLGARNEGIAWLRRLREVCEERGRPPPLEFNLPLWPELPAMLDAAGFVEENREPLMLCTPSDFHPLHAPDVSVRFLTAPDSDEDLAAYREIFRRVMQVDLWRSTEDVRLEVGRERGRSHALALLDGTPAGTGFISSSVGVAEITRVATLPEARRRGVAATLTSFMMQDRFDAGDTLVWLTAQAPAAQALYQRLGFRSVGDRSSYRMQTIRCGRAL